jgi:hypothetical protein
MTCEVCGGTGWLPTISVVSDPEVNGKDEGREDCPYCRGDNMDDLSKLIEMLERNERAAIERCESRGLDDREDREVVIRELNYGIASAFEEWTRPGSGVSGEQLELPFPELVEDDDQ